MTVVTLPVMAWGRERAEELLTGPWGRRLCVEVLADARLVPEGMLDSLWWRGPYVSAPSADIADALAAVVERADLDGVRHSTDPAALLPALARAVDAAAYWQPLDEVTRALAGDTVRRSLFPVADAIAVAPACRWWDTPIARDEQHEVHFEGLPEPAGSAVAALQAWRSDTLDDERRAADRPSDPSAPWSGRWWSTPALVGLVHSTRWLAGTGPVGLVLVEDSMGWTSAATEPVLPRPDARVYEIDCPTAWSELVARYPLNVTKSRRHDWWKITGETGNWLLPDYAAVAEDYDAVHLSICGYLSSAARALRVGDAATVLAGWDLDSTWWLTDSFTSGTATLWSIHEQEGPFTWGAEG